MPVSCAENQKNMLFQEAPPPSIDCRGFPGRPFSIFFPLRGAVDPYPQDKIAGFVIGFRDVFGPVENEVGFDPPIALKMVTQPRRQPDKIIITVCFFQVEENLRLKGYIEPIGKIAWQAIQGDLGGNPVAKPETRFPARIVKGLLQPFLKSGIIP